MSDFSNNFWMTCWSVFFFGMEITTHSGRGTSWLGILCWSYLLQLLTLHLKTKWDNFTSILILAYTFIKKKISFSLIPKRLSKAHFQSKLFQKELTKIAFLQKVSPADVGLLQLSNGVFERGLAAVAFVEAVSNVGEYLRVTNESFKNSFMHFMTCTLLCSFI